ncbi:MAG: C40 family peptidase [Spirochaetaceae bacterium]|jgi:hypothetical protein|nr:C40 family peptidase [Spirochaetaceae bacterium]
MMRSLGCLFLIPLLSLSVLSCSNLIIAGERGMVLCPEDVALRAENGARLYCAADTRYLWGGQDRLGAAGPLKIDCSGLVVNCFRTAAYEAGYELPFADASVGEFLERYSVPIRSPRPGDVVFMGAPRQSPTHMGIFVGRDAHQIWFIDSTIKPEEQIDGVSLRSYPEDDPRLLSFGRLLLVHR